MTPLAFERYQITFTASASTREKLELAQDLLRGNVAERPGAGARTVGEKHHRAAVH